ncbi:MAG TPA: hypothetical protein VES39_03820 [Rhodospirillales bacterium]|nr:hypothetical protein [Rhodospirillales bacterium]
MIAINTAASSVGHSHAVADRGSRAFAVRPAAPHPFVVCMSLLSASAYPMARSSSFPHDRLSATFLSPVLAAARASHR